MASIDFFTLAAALMSSRSRFQMDIAFLHRNFNRRFSWNRALRLKVGATSLKACRCGFAQTGVADDRYMHVTMIPVLGARGLAQRIKRVDEGLPLQRWAQRVIGSEARPWVCAQ